MQPLYRECEVYAPGVGAELFLSGLCLPSGPVLSEEEQGRVVEVVRGVCRAGWSSPGSVDTPLLR